MENENSVKELNEQKAACEEFQELVDGSVTDDETYESMMIKQAEEGNEQSYYESESDENN